MGAYKEAYQKVVAPKWDEGSKEEKQALQRFTKFLEGVGNAEYIQKHVREVYSDDAFLDDTLVVKRGVQNIEQYFLKTAKNMTTYKTTIDDIARSGDDYYVRWTMIFAAEGFSGGNPVHSVGITHIRFNKEGKVAVHQDYWDAAKNFYAHLPVAGGVIGFIQKKLNK